MSIRDTWVERRAVREARHAIRTTMKELGESMEAAERSTRDALEQADKILELHDGIKDMKNCLKTLDDMILVQRANRIGLSVPGEDDQECWLKENDLTFLTEYGRAKILREISIERFARAERWTKLLAPWIPVVTLLIGYWLGNRR